MDIKMTKTDAEYYLIGISEFVLRQTAESQFTHFNGDWEELRQMVTKVLIENTMKLIEGYRKGVILVPVAPDRFYTYTDFPMFVGMKMSCEWAKTSGREYEPAKLQVKILEPKIKCNYVDIVLYKRDVLEEDGDSVTGAEYDVISINGRLKKEPHPMDPMTIVGNWLHLKGGTEMKGKTEKDVLNMLCESIMFKNGMKKQWKRISKQLS
jgi:hypothetical protein